LVPFPGLRNVYGLTEGVGKAYISNLVPQEKTGTAFGIYQTTIGLCTFFASLIAGLFWTYIDVSGAVYFWQRNGGDLSFFVCCFGKKDQPW